MSVFCRVWSLAYHLLWFCGLFTPSAGRNNTVFRYILYIMLNKINYKTMHALCTLSDLEDETIFLLILGGKKNQKRFKGLHDRINKRDRMHGIRKNICVNYSAMACNSINALCYWTYPIGNFHVFLS